MTTDGLNALQLEYNFLNLTGAVSDSSGDPLATYTWLADGTKVGVVDDDGHGLEYTGSLIYRRNGTELELESTSFGGERIEVLGTEDIDGCLARLDRHKELIAPPLCIYQRSLIFRTTHVTVK
jgi:hypothetical protein